MPAKSINPFAVYLRELQRYPVMECSEEADLTRRARPDNSDLTDRQAARDRLVVANLALVIHISKRMGRRHGPMPDRVAAGNIGLVYAACCKTFDSTRGCFSTYAACWIRQSISRNGTIDRYPVYIPTHILDDIRRLERGEAMSAAHAERAASALAVRSMYHPDADCRARPIGFVAEPECDTDLELLQADARDLPGVAGRLVNLRLDGGPMNSIATARALGVSRAMVYWAELQIREWATGVRNPVLHRTRAEKSNRSRRD
jgi:hypothetical protein